jgi:hypothetical protein
MRMPTSIVCPECQRTLAEVLSPNRFSPLVILQLCRGCLKRLSAEASVPVRETIRARKSA